MSIADHLRPELDLAGKLCRSMPAIVRDERIAEV